MQVGSRAVRRVQPCPCHRTPLTAPGRAAHLAEVNWHLGRRRWSRDELSDLAAAGERR